MEKIVKEKAREIYFLHIPYIRVPGGNTDSINHENAKGPKKNWNHDIFRHYQGAISFF